MAPFCVLLSNNVVRLSQAVISWCWGFLEQPVCTAAAAAGAAGGGGGGGCTGLG